MHRVTLATAVLLSALPALAGRPRNGTELGPSTVGAGLERYQFTQPQRIEVGSGRTTVAAETNSTGPNHGGYPFRVFIDNSTGPRQTLTLTFRASQSSGAARTVTRRVELSEGERRTVSLVLFADMRYGLVEARGPGITNGGSTSVYGNEVPAAQRLVLSLGEPEVFEHFAGHPPSYSGATTLITSIPASDAPVEVMAYSGYDAVTVPEEGGFDALSEAQRAALERYVLLGGTLVLNGVTHSQASLPLLAKDSSTLTQPYGLGFLSMAPGTAKGAFATVPWAVDTVTPANFDTRAYDRYGRRGAGSTSTALLPQATAPLGSFLFIIVLFTLAIGPGSVWVSRRRGPAALLFSIPFTAFITCAAIIGYSLAADGFSVHGAVYGFTQLDRARNRAITIGVTSYYANLAPSDVRFDAATELMSVPGLEDSMASMEWSDGVRLGADFVPSRVYREWGMATVAPTRARLVLKQRNGGWVVQNALGGGAKEVHVNLDGTQWQVVDLPEGAERPLSKRDCGGEGKACASAPLEDRALSRFDDAVQAHFVNRPLAPGEFTALVDGQGFVPSGGIGLLLVSSQHFVRGEVTP